MDYKSCDGLMRHLRKQGIAIAGTKQKRQLLNTGYFHGYKGYRFFKDPANRLPFKAYAEVYATIQYDAKLKSLFYGKVMYIETAVKNIALESILSKARSKELSALYARAVSGYHNTYSNTTSTDKKSSQTKKLNLQRKNQELLARAYEKGDRKIVHYYNKGQNNSAPIWALLEIMSLGEFANLLSCLTLDCREDISKRLGLNLRSDTNRELVYDYLYTIKDLRNALAHNAVIFDTRFRQKDPSRAMTKTLADEMGLSYVNFKTIGDYLILICYYLKLLKIPKIEIKAFIREFEKITEDYKRAVNLAVAKIVVHPDLAERITTLKKHI